MKRTLLAGACVLLLIAELRAAPALYQLDVSGVLSDISIAGSVNHDVFGTMILTLGLRPSPAIAGVVSATILESDFQVVTRDTGLNVNTLFVPGTDFEGLFDENDSTITYARSVEEFSLDMEFSGTFDPDTVTIDVRGITPSIADAGHELTLAGSGVLIPVPSSVAVLAGGLGFVCWARRRRSPAVVSASEAAGTCPGLPTAAGF